MNIIFGAGDWNTKSQLSQKMGDSDPEPPTLKEGSAVVGFLIKSKTALEHSNSQIIKNLVNETETDSLLLLRDEGGNVHVVSPDIIRLVQIDAFEEALSASDANPDTVNRALVSLLPPGYTVRRTIIVFLLALAVFCTAFFGGLHYYLSSD